MILLIHYLFVYNLPRTRLYIIILPPHFNALSGTCCMPGKIRLTTYLLRISAKMNTIRRVIITQYSILCNHGQKSHHRHLALPWSKCSKTNLNPTTKDDKKPVAMSCIPTATGFVYNVMQANTTCRLLTIFLIIPIQSLLAVCSLRRRRYG